ncbi:MAG: hypothetical protein SGPRY_011785 [Prymnesium sp.]
MAGFAASRILDVLLGEYIEEDKGARQIELDLLKGHLLLRNIAVRSGALQRALGLPLVIKHGVIARIELRIPWGKLGSEPTRLTLDGLLVYVTPQSEAEWDAYAEEEREFLRKQATLNKINPTAEAQGGQAAEPGEQKQSFISKLTSQVDVSNVTIRYTDTSHGSKPYSISLHLNSLLVRSTETSGSKV